MSRVKQYAAAKEPSISVPFNPLMLTIVREHRKMSQTALAGVAHVRQPLISQIEAGRHHPSAAVANRLAEALRCPLSLLQVYTRFQQLPLTFFRKKSRMSVREVKAIRAHVNLYRLRVEILLRSYEINEARIILADRQRGGNPAARAARDLRVYWNIPPGPIQNLTELVESRGILIIPMDSNYSGFDGLSIHEPNDILPPIIFLNPDVPADRWRMTLAHELGHIILHHHQPKLLDDHKLEREAYDFATEFLAPAQEVAGHLRLVTLQRLAALKFHWGLSMAAFLKRAENRRYISKWEARKLWIRLRQGGTVEPVTVPKEHPRLLREIIAFHRKDLGQSIADISATLHQYPMEFRADFGFGSLRLV